MQHAAGQFTTQRKCSVTARVSTNAVFCAVSTSGSPPLLSLMFYDSAKHFAKLPTYFYRVRVALWEAQDIFFFKNMNPLTSLNHWNPSLCSCCHMDALSEARQS